MGLEPGPEVGSESGLGCNSACSCASLPTGHFGELGVPVDEIAAGLGAGAGVEAGAGTGAGAGAGAAVVAAETSGGTGA